jgi:hypothetical protein
MKMMTSWNLMKGISGVGEFKGDLKVKIDWKFIGSSFEI